MNSRRLIAAPPGSGQAIVAGQTAVTQLAEAECSNAEIAAITGHSMHDVGAILDKYLARTDKIAMTAIAKLERGKK